MQGIETKCCYKHEPITKENDDLSIAIKKMPLGWYCVGWLSLFGVRIDFGVRVKKSLESQALFRKLSTTIFARSL